MAREFIEHTFDLFPRAHVVFILRLNFAASEKRHDLMSRFPPDVFVLPNRPSFRNGKTDATEYAWFVWPPEKRRSNGAFKVLSLTDRSKKLVLDRIVEANEPKPEVAVPVLPGQERLF